MAPTRRPTAIAAAVLAAGLLTGCSDLSSGMNPNDALGYIACRDAVVAQATDSGDERDELLGSAAASAAASQTPALRQVVSPPVNEDQLERVGPEDRDLFSVELDELLVACEQSGFDADAIDLAGSVD